jgi:hypothetical protein
MKIEFSNRNIGQFHTEHFKNQVLFEGLHSIYDVSFTITNIIWNLMLLLNFLKLL